ncbi:hypothetical protein C491_14747 [Natronococcus amylolyticus DSM 10524]|uniref:DUF6884 domain-containing protein n=1 Tax=Natronococcus amylolyticus DSM 10524 TaxID=1227497 RepID=L9X3B2_9EURY|nr:hypothetical protein C491_14747 [Natronococcus amylolyticus DSM 10524]
MWARSTGGSFWSLEAGTTLVFYARRAYHEELLSLLEETTVSVQLPAEGLMIGERLQWFCREAD